MQGAARPRYCSWVRADGHSTAAHPRVGRRADGVTPCHWSGADAATGGCCTCNSMPHIARLAAADIQCVRGTNANSATTHVTSATLSLSTGATCEACPSNVREWQTQDAPVASADNERKAVVRSGSVRGSTCPDRSPARQQHGDQQRAEQRREIRVDTLRPPSRTSPSSRRRRPTALPTAAGSMRPCRILRRR